MDGFLAFLGIICFLFFMGAFISIFVILGRTSTLLENVERIQKKLYTVGQDLAALKVELAKIQSTASSGIPVEKSTTTTEASIKVTPIKEPAPEIQTPIITPEIKKEEPPIVPPIETPVITPELKEEAILFIPSTEPVKETLNTSTNTIPPTQKKIQPKEPSFFEKNPDLEKFIGENLINKIGIAILVIGIGFFVKFAIDKDWINEIGRVFIGILCGGILVGLAHYFRNSFKAFSSVLVGGGMAIFYLTIAIAFHEYQLFSQTIAFIIMVVITAFSVLLSITYDRKELAVLAIIGGFASPFMVSTGQGNYHVLFSYILILNTGMLLLSYFKRWNIVNIVCFVFTSLLYSAWLYKSLNDPEKEFPTVWALVYATLFYLLFFLMNILNNIKENTKFVAVEISILLANTFLYFSSGMAILKNIESVSYQGLFTILIALFNYGFAYTLYKNKKVDSNLVYLLIGLVLTFVTLAAPIQLEGSYITLFWAGETALLLWLSQKSGIKLMKLASILIVVLMMVSLIMDWNNVYRNGLDIIPIAFNKGFTTSIAVIASLVLSLFLLKSEDTILIAGLDKKIYTGILELLFVLVVYFGGIQEVYFQFQNRVAIPQNLWDVTPVYTGCFNLVYIVFISLYVYYKEIKWMHYLPIALTVLISLVYLSYYNPTIADLRTSYLTSNAAAGPHFWFHYINIGLLIFSVVFGFKVLLKNFTKTHTNFSFYLWFSCAVLVYLASAELESFVLISSYGPDKDMYAIQHQNYKVGFPILWGICSFAMMVIGMKLKIKTLRIISLSLFSIALLKMFVFDIREMSEGGKIAAFISLGVLLLIISFMYQKLKKILTEE